LEARGFSSQDFAKYHPGGALGKQLYLTVADVIPKNLVPVVKEDALLTEIIVEISSKRLGATAVVDYANQLLGIITDGDLRRMLLSGADIRQVQAREIMTENPKTISQDEFAINALNRMKDFNITQLVAMDGDHIAGFIHIHDLMKEGIV
jgi:arabinose-5-phosphate isomerase